MSTPEGLAPTVVLGQAVMLPQYGRIDLAYTTNVQPANPAAGAEYIYTVPGGIVVIPQSIFFQLVSNGSGSSRAVFVDYRDADSNVIMRHLANSAQPINSTWQYSFMLNGGSSFNVSSRAIAPLAFMVLAEGYSIRLGIQSLQAGDQVQNVNMTVQAIPTGPPLPSSSAEPAETPVLS